MLAPTSTTIVLSFNTNMVRRTNGFLVPVVTNGNGAITAQLFVVGASTPQASNAIQVVLNNDDALVALGSDGAIPGVTITPNAPLPTFTDGDGNVWHKGSSTVAGAQYISFSTKTPTSLAFEGDVCGTSTSVVTGNAVSGIGLSGVWSCTNSEGENTLVDFDAPTFDPPLNGPDGTALTPPTFFSNIGGGFPVVGDTRWNLITPAVPTQDFASLFIDNKAPTVSIVGTVAFNENWDQPWINATTYNLLDNLSSVDGGTGVATTTARVYGSSCGATDLPNPSNLAETVTSTATDGWRICGASTDNIGNSSVSGPSNFFGSDAGNPTVRIAGSTAATPALVTAATANVSATANTTIFGIAAQAAFGVSAPAVATDLWGLEGQDTRSGFNQFEPVLGPPGPAIQSLDILNPAGATCTIPSLLLSTILSDTWVRTLTLPGITCGVANQPGYYNFTGHVVDRAGNSSPTVGKNYAVDQVAGPNITGLGFATALYTPGNPAPFGFSANDDLEIIDGTLAVSQLIPTGGATALRYPLGTLTPLGTRWDATLTNVLNGQNASIPYFIFRVDEMCSATATPYANCPDPTGLAYNPLGAPYITTSKLAVVDAAQYLSGAAHLPTSVSANVDDVAWQVAGAPISAPMLNTQFSPNTGISEQWTGADIISWDLDLVSTPGTAIARHVASTSIVVPFFDNASLWRLYGTEWVNCGAFPAPALTDNGQHRFWTYTLTVPTTGACSLGGGGGYRAMGTKVGAGLFTPTR